MRLYGPDRGDAPTQKIDRALDGDLESSFDDIVRLASQCCGTPLGSLCIDDPAGPDGSATRFCYPDYPAAHALCECAIEGGEVLVVADLREDERFSMNSAVVDEPHIRFYAGAPLVSRTGERLGVLSVLDHEPRRLSPAQLENLKTLARLAVGQLALCRERIGPDPSYRALFEQAPDAVFILDLQGRHVEANRSAVEMLGYSHDELVALTYRDTSADPERSSGVLERILRGEHVEPYERTFIRKDNTRVPVEIYLAPLYDDSGKISRIQSIVRDLSARKRSETVLREREARYRAITESATDAIITTDSRGVIVGWNSAARATFGFEQDEVVGQSLTMIMPERFRRQHEAGLNRVAGGGEKRLIGKTVEVEGRRKDGTTFPIELSLSEWDTAEGRFFSAIAREISERKRSEARIQAHLERLTTLHRIDRLINSGLPLAVMLDLVVEQLVTHLSVDAASVRLLNPLDFSLAFAAGRGFRSGAIETPQPARIQGVAHRAMLERRSIRLADPALAPDWARHDLLDEEGFTDYLVFPLPSKGRVLGVLELFNRTHAESDADWHTFLETLAEQLATAIESARLFHDVERSNLHLVQAYDATIEGWSRALDLRDRETEGHTQRVTELTVQIMQRAGCSPEELVHIRRGALLHDIGKMGVPDSILLKPGKLTEDEWRVMRQHPEFALRLLSPIEYLRPALDIPYCHHEKWDGSGYPRQLRGEEIPFSARVFAVVDVWDALSSDRPYREAWKPDRVMRHIREQTGTHFDPQAVELFMQVMESES